MKATATNNAPEMKGIAHVKGASDDAVARLGALVETREAIVGDPQHVFTLWMKAPSDLVGETVVREALDLDCIDVALRLLRATVPFCIECDDGAPPKIRDAATAEATWIRRRLASQLSLACDPARVWALIERWEAEPATGERASRLPLLCFHYVAFLGTVVSATSAPMARLAWRYASPTLRSHIVQAASGRVDTIAALAERTHCRRAWWDTAHDTAAHDKRQDKNKGTKALPDLVILMRRARASIHAVALHVDPHQPLI
ncbi:hypothetical protein pmac_cds_605 [Pandoravirus macleodensis]|uniref:Uncharacterized protein n=1 Tax=Pandoravirus macleodensis TaxID=2107707 RepID=A0A2U7UFN7_9VIRU|nr:hypothetical protein pmac_cds_605 [Pandoravirus macleodensis]AVK77293.1 hypothetical protein pmac_cds_605 [Pandoravirus macleodensis]UMO80039.1 hypothetical protein [Pandoravirus aubagnensis]